MSDIIVRLRGDTFLPWQECAPTMIEAADEIEKLRERLEFANNANLKFSSEIERLRGEVERLRGEVVQQMTWKTQAQDKRDDLQDEVDSLRNLMKLNRQVHDVLEAERDAAVKVLIELRESASYWSEYDVPVGIVDRIDAAINTAREVKP